MNAQPPHPDGINPYAAPRAELAIEEGMSAGPELADRWTRLGACLLDVIISGLPAFLAIWGGMTLLGYRFFDFESQGTTQWTLKLGSMAVGMGIYLAINGYLLARDGQTVGKRICSIRITRQDGTPATLWDSFVKRYLLLGLIQQIPFVGALFGLVDSLFIFGERRLCLHDRVAGTMVVAVRGWPLRRQEVPPPPKAETAPAPLPAQIEICPYCAEITSPDSNTCRGCGRNPFSTDGLNANRVLTVEELLQKAARLYRLKHAQEALDTHRYATLKFAFSREAWLGLLNAPNADVAMQEEARSQLQKIEQVLRG
jgi:uncharacterized RDD family membrane protein YckC